MLSASANDVKRVAYYRWLTATTIIATVLVTWNLWSCERYYPTAPLFGTQSFISGNYAFLFRVALIILSLLFAFKLNYVEWFLCSLLVVGFADDLNRLLPNTYQFAIILLLFGLHKQNKEHELLSALRIIQGGVYLWTGILKLNSGFVNNMSQFIYTTLRLKHPPEYLKYTLLFVSIWEIAIGLSFLSGKKVKAAIISAVPLHLIIILILVLSAWNRTIISYNLFLVAGNFVLFSKSSYRVMNDIRKPVVLVQKIAIALFIVLPALNLAHLWPDFMSSSLYSGRGLSAAIYVDDKLKKQLPDAALKAVFDSPNGPYISVTHWIQNETGTVPNPQRFVYNKMYTQFRTKYNCTDSVRMVIY